MADSAREIENLLYTYAERLDSGDLEAVAELFANGRIKPAPDAAAEATFEGRERVLEMYRAATRLYEDGTPRKPSFRPLTSPDFLSKPGNEI